MAKQKSSIRYVLKINSTRIRESNWNLIVDINEAIENEELISLADSSVLRFIRDIKGINDSELNREIEQLKRDIKKIKKEYSSELKSSLLEKYNSLYMALYIPEYVSIVMDNNKDFDTLNKKEGFFINNRKYKRLLATTGGAKNNTVVYVSEDVHGALNSRLDNGRNLKGEFVPAKLEAYKALACSSSIPVPNPKGVLVIDDCVTNFKSNIIKIDDSRDGEPLLTFEKDYDVELVESDGYGLISPELSEEWSRYLDEKYISAGFCIRNSFLKGMVFTFDYMDFADSVANKYMVTDAWGDDIDIRTVQLVLTTSMLKLWDSYEDIDHYLRCCSENNYTFSITKMLPNKLENERNLNYQFIQSLELSDSDISELINPTIQDIKDCLGGDWRKSLLFLKGTKLHFEGFNELDPDFSKALMIDKKMINDPFVRDKIHNAIKKRINDAKIGVLKVKGNFSIISGDPYSLCQSMFGMEVTGLLKSGEFYSKYWSDEGTDKVACFRAPMTCHNNIRILRLKNESNMRYWYKYMTTATIFNSWDTTAHALNGADKDSDSVLTTDNSTILRNIKELDAIVCQQKSVSKVIPTERRLITANKKAFGDAIGTITNRITSMFDVLATLDRHSEEYSLIEYRIMCGQNYQQNAIDKAKGIVSKSMPKEWYDYLAADNSSDINKKIVSDKKPYFFIYIYPHIMKKYKVFRRNAEENCLINFKIELDEILSKVDRSEDEEAFVQYYYATAPVSMNESTMNKICRKIESEFKDINLTINNANFDYSILKTDCVYTDEDYKRVESIYEEYVKKTREFSSKKNYEKIDKEEKFYKRQMFLQKFKRKVHSVCENDILLTNIVLDICYTKNGFSKQFTWDMCGEQILKNLLIKNAGKVNIPTLDDLGDFYFNGEKYKMSTYYLEEDDI